MKRPGLIWCIIPALLSTSVAFALNVGTNLDQLQNGNPPKVPNWANGDINKQNSQYAEGRSVPFRYFVTGVGPSETHYFTIQSEWTKGGEHAYDYFTDFDRTEGAGVTSAGGPCGTISTSPPGDCGALTISAAFPNPKTAANWDFTSVGGSAPPDFFPAAFLVDGTPTNLKAYNVSLITFSAVTGAAGKFYSFTGTSSDREINILVTFTTPSTLPPNSSVGFYWGGHLALGLDASHWGAGNGAGSISGAPFHMRAINIDGDGGRNQDRSIQPSAIAIPSCDATATGGTLTCTTTSVVLSASSTSAASFSWAGPGIVSGGGTANPTVSSTGTYTVTVTNSATGCTSTATSSVNENKTAPGASATGGTLTCTTTSVILSAASGSCAAFSWSGPGIVSGSTTANPTVSSSGTYTVTVTCSANGCTSTATASVGQDKQAPGASATGGTLTCSSTCIVISGSTTSGTSFSWAGPSFSSSAQNPTVCASGTYTLTVTNSANGCTSTATASVTQTGAPPGASATGGTLTCTTASVLLSAATTSGTSFVWSGPCVIGSPNIANPSVTCSGTFTVTVTNSANGCTSTATALVGQDKQAPGASATGGTLTCSSTCIVISGSTASGTSFSWSGPYFTSSLQNPTVCKSGTYTLTVTNSANGCTSTATASVGQDKQAPGASATGGTLTCASTCIVISGATTSGTSFSWAGPGFSSAAQNPTVCASGTYTLTVTNSANGCTSTATASVNENKDVPGASATGGTLTCSTTSVVLSAASGSCAAFSWSGPGIVSGGNSANPRVSATGTYTVTVTCSANGCTSTATAPVTGTGEAPGVSASGGELTCTTTSVVLSASSSTGGVSFSWAGTGIVSGGNTANPTVTASGTYTVTVTNSANGCNSTATALVTQGASTCIQCNGGTIIVDQNVTIDFNVTPPTYTGDTDLQPFFSFDKSGGSTADKWNAIFDVGANKLLVKNGATITTSQVNGYAPGIIIKSTCELEVENGGRILVVSSNRNAGNILIQVNGHIIVNGEIRDEVTGTLGLPGSITATSKCGNFSVGTTGRIQDLGVDPGGNTISLLACGGDCFPGDMTISGLVRAFAHAHAQPLTENRPNIRVVAFNGSITINANTVEPLLDEFTVGGTRYDLWGGLLSWVRDNVNPGKVEVQAKFDITVNGHGADPTGAVRESFGAIAAVATASDAPGGLVDVRSLEGSIIGNDRAFDVSGRNRLATNFAHIRLWSKLNISLNRLGATNSFNPVVDASSPSVGDKGGTNELRAYSGGITVGANALVSAAVPAGSGSVQGVNLLTSCLGVTNNGTVNPTDVDGGDDAGVCAPAAPAALYTSCTELGGVFKGSDSGAGFSPVIPQRVELLQNYPNPFNPTTTIRFALPEPSRVRISVYNILGQEIARLVDGTVDAGYNQTVWDYRTTTGFTLSSGIYFYRLSAVTVESSKEFIQVKKMLLLK